MIISKKALPRRTFLRGMGASLALPLLVRPKLLEKLGVKALDGNGWLQVRGIYGGLLLALAVVCFVTREPYAFLTPGVALLGFAAAGLMALAVERPRPGQGLAVDGAHALMGALLLVGFWGW